MSSGFAFFAMWLFITAAAHKFYHPDYYQRLLSSYFEALNVGRNAVFVLAIAELVIALSLFFRTSREAGLLSSALLLALYGAVMAIQVKRGRDDLACGCAGPASMLTVSPALVVRNIVCAAVAVLALSGSAPLTPGLIAYALSAGIAMFLIVLYTCSDQLIANAQIMAGDL